MRASSRTLFGPRRQQNEIPRVSMRHKAWEAFCNDDQLKKAYNIKPEEMEMLRQTALLGNVRGKDDFIFILIVSRRRSS